MATGKITNNLKTNRLQISYTAAANVTIRSFGAYRSGNIVVIELYFDTSAAISNNGAIANFPSGLPEPVGAYATAFARSVEGGMAMVSLESRDITAIRAWATVPKGTYFYALFTYVAQ